MSNILIRRRKTKVCHSTDTKICHSKISQSDSLEFSSSSSSDTNMIGLSRRICCTCQPNITADRRLKFTHTQCWLINSNIDEFRLFFSFSRQFNQHCARGEKKSRRRRRRNSRMNLTWKIRKDFAHRRTLISSIVRMSSPRHARLTPIVHSCVSTHTSPCTKRKTKSIDWRFLFEQRRRRELDNEERLEWFDNIHFD